MQHILQMTTFENKSREECLLLPTDLSLKNVFRKKTIVGNEQAFPVIFPASKRPEIISHLEGLHRNSDFLPSEQLVTDCVQDCMHSHRDQIHERIFVLDPVCANNSTGSSPNNSPHKFNSNIVQQMHDDEENWNDNNSLLTESLLAMTKDLKKTRQNAFIDKRVRPSDSGSFDSNRKSPTVFGNNSKTCKRKGGWKFHDFSGKGGDIFKRKRPYGQSKIESEILQVYRNRVLLKEVCLELTEDRVGERFVVIEPASISDPDLINCNTSLRMVLDKQQESYKLQVLPFTIEEGPLNNKNQVLEAVGKMLGDTGAVLCPGITNANSFQASEQRHKEFHTFEICKNLNSREMSALERFHISKKNSFRSDNWNYKNFKPVTYGSSDAALSLTSRSSKSPNCENSYANRFPDTLPSNNIHPAARFKKCLLWHEPALIKDKNHNNLMKEHKWCQHCIENGEVLKRY